MTSEPSVSVAIPTYNNAPTLPSALEAVKEQTLEPTVLTVVDGGSTDGTLEIARRFGAEIMEQTDDGLATARNLALEACQTDILAMVDADTVPSERWLEVAVDVLHEYEADLVGVEIVEQGDSLSARWRARRMPFNSRRDTGSIDRVPGNNMVFWTDAVRAVDGWSESYQFAHEDIDLCNRLRDAGQTIVYTPETTVDHYGVTGLEVVKHLWQWHSPDGGPDTYTEFLSRMVQHFGKAVLYSLDDVSVGYFSGLPLNAATLPVHVWLDWKQVRG